MAARFCTLYKCEQIGAKTLTANISFWRLGWPMSEPSLSEIELLIEPVVFSFYS